MDQEPYEGRGGAASAPGGPWPCRLHPRGLQASAFSSRPSPEAWKRKLLPSPAGDGCLPAPGEITRPLLRFPHFGQIPPPPPPPTDSHADPNQAWTQEESHQVAGDIVAQW